MIKFLALSGFLFFSNVAFAEECIGSPDEIAACKEWQAADTKLNAAYRALIFSLDHPPSGMAEHHARAKKSVILAQRTWLQFRENDCAAVFDIADGSSRGPLSKSCEAQHSILRTAQLENMANGL